MPRFDGTGPGKQGSKTGRGLGRCNPDSDFLMGRGRGGRARGCGRGYGFGFMQNLNCNKEDIIEDLKKQKEEIEQKISLLENGKDES
jgi:hypothetical protein